MLKESHLCCARQKRVTFSVIINLKLENSINVWNFELGFVEAGFVPSNFGQSGSNEWVNTNEFELHIVSIVSGPRPIFQFFEDDIVHHIFGNGVGGRSILLASLVMRHVA